MSYYEYNETQLAEGAKIYVDIMEDNPSVFEAMADEMIQAITENNRLGEKTVFIVPVGPIGHYPYFVQKVNDNNISLQDTWFINMDEYLDNMEWIDKKNKLSFRRFMDTEVYDKINPSLNIPKTQRIFPNPNDLTEIPTLINNIGKIDIAFGGIGINGHIAFNEPMANIDIEKYLKLPTRTLEIATETRVVNSIADLNGAYDLMPTHCVTIGLAEIFSAKKIRLGVFRDWHRSVIRRAVHGEPTTEFPVTLLQTHKDIKIYCTKFVANLPK